MAYPESIGSLELNLPKKMHWVEQNEPRPVRTPSEWFAAKFPDAASRYGCPFLEMRQSSFDGFSSVNPISINVDFFAGMLGGDSKLGHSVVYFENEMQWYFRDWDNIYKPTSPEKLQNYYRAMLLRCIQELGNDVDKLNLYTQFRADKVARAVTTRAKSILSCSSSFFSATSPHTRIKGVELHERLARNLVETMLEPRDGACLTVTQAYQVFCRLSQQRSLDVIKRSMFRELMRDLISERYGKALRHDVPDSQNKHQQAWKGLALVDGDLAA